MLGTHGMKLSYTAHTSSMSFTDYFDEGMVEIPALPSARKLYQELLPQLA